MGGCISPNLYAFVGWNPAMGVDPEGKGLLLAAVCIWKPGLCKGAAAAAWETAKSVASLPGRIIKHAEEDRAARMAAFQQGGYEAYTQVSQRQGAQDYALAKKIGVEAIPGVGSGRALGEAVEACSNGSDFECGAKGFSAGLRVAGDVAVVGGVASKALQLGRASVSVEGAAAVAEGTIETAAAEGSVGKLTYFHQMKAGKVTDVAELSGQVEMQIQTMNKIIENEGIAGLKKRIVEYRADPGIEQAGRAHVRSLGPAGCTECGDPLAWLHGPDMGTGGGPTDIVGRGLLRNNSIVGGQANRIADEILAMPDEVTRIEGQLVVKPVKVRAP